MPTLLGLDFQGPQQFGRQASQSATALRWAKTPRNNAVQESHDQRVSQLERENECLRLRVRFLETKDKKGLAKWTFTKAEA